MFTVKFFSQAAHRGDSQVLIVEGDEVEILPPTESYDHFVRVIGKAGAVGRAISWISDECRENAGPQEAGLAPYFEAIIENSSGKTTHIVRAKQPTPPRTIAPWVAVQD